MEFDLGRQQGEICLARKAGWAHSGGVSTHCTCPTHPAIRMPDSVLSDLRSVILPRSLNREGPSGHSAPDIQLLLRCRVFHCSLWCLGWRDSSLRLRLSYMPRCIHGYPVCFACVFAAVEQPVRLSPAVIHYSLQRLLSAKPVVMDLPALCGRASQTRLLSAIVPSNVCWICERGSGWQAKERKHGQNTRVSGPVLPPLYLLSILRALLCSALSFLIPCGAVRQVWRWAVPIF